MAACKIKDSHQKWRIERICEGTDNSRSIFDVIELSTKRNTKDSAERMIQILAPFVDLVNSGDPVISKVLAR